MRPNIDRIIKLRDHLLHVAPDRIALGFFWEGGRNDCGSVGCVAGHTVALFATKEQWDSTDVGEYDEAFHGLATKLLGFDVQPAPFDSRFMEPTDASEKVLLDLFSGGDSGEQGRAEAIRRIDRLLARLGVTPL